jgi:RNA polymerase sigma-70 factor (ECF subfamily)
MKMTHVMRRSPLSPHGLAGRSWPGSGAVARGRREWELEDARRLEEAPDSILVRLACQGRRAAAEELIRRYQDRIYTLAYGYLHDPEEALDITQEIFVRMVEGLPRFREQANFYTWLYRIAVNRCIDRCRQTRQQPSPASLEDFETDQAAEMTETRAGHCPQAALEARELRDQIQAAIAALPEAFRMIVILADIEGLSYAEIAPIVGCPVNTVKTRLHRGRLALRVKLEPYLKGAVDR